MGIETEQLIYDYLSQVGDLAQQALPAGRRRELVARLREDIERERAEEADDPAAVRRILGRLGSPNSVVEAEAWRRAAEGVPPPFPGDVSQGEGLFQPEPQWWRASGAGPLDPPGMSAGEAADRPAVPGPRAPLDGADDPEEGTDGEAARRPWWSRPAALGKAAGGRARDGSGPEWGEVPPEEVVRSPRGGLLSGRGALVHWRELLAAALLVGGTVAGQWIVVVVGWVLAYYSARLSRLEAQLAAVGIPLLSAATAGVYLWGRAEGRWGEPLAEGHLRPVLEDLAPLMVRVAAIGSAVYLLWRADRRSRMG